MQTARVIDGDGHIFEDAEAISRFVPAPFRDMGPFPLNRLVPPLDHLHAHIGQTPPGSFQHHTGPVEWLQFLDDVGIEAAVLYPTAYLACGRMPNIDWAIASTRAYNDWLHATYLSQSPRFKGMGVLPLQDGDAASAELRRVVQDLGMCGAMLPSQVVSGHLGARRYWPIYREADRLGCCLAVHGGCHGGFGMDDLNVFAPVHAIGHPLGLMITLGTVVFNGLLDQFPGVRWGFLEGGVAWLLLVLERFDTSYGGFTPVDPTGQLLQLEPNERVSDYIRKQLQAGRLFVGSEGDEPALPYLVKTLGADGFVFSSDFPHEVNPASCRAEIEELLTNDELSAAAKEAILHGNAERLYNLQPASREVG